MNEVQTFVLEDNGIRGALVRLEETWQRVVAAPDYPPEVRALLGDSIVSTLLLATGLKATPSVSLQLQGQGPLKLLLVHCTDGQRVRGMASVKNYSAGTPLLGEGRLVVNLDTGKPNGFFQGIVPLTRFIDAREHLEILANGITFTRPRARELIEQYLGSQGCCGGKCGPDATLPLRRRASTLC